MFYFLIVIDQEIDHYKKLKAELDIKIAEVSRKFNMKYINGNLKTVAG